jgi:acyl carrier protein phosphodiesterase
MDEGKDSHISRERYDQEYEEEYPKWKKIIFKLLEKDINSYTKINDGNIIVLFNNKDLTKNLIKYDKINERLWYDYSLQENWSDYIPDNYLSRHFKYAIQDYFKKHFPQYGVREITAANIG